MRHPLFLILLFFGGIIIIFGLGYYLGGQVSPRAGKWLVLTMFVSIWAAIQWIWLDFGHTAPIAIQIASVALITGLICWTTYLLLQ